MAKNCFCLLPITPRILFSNKLLMTTSNFDPNLSVDKAKTFEFLQWTESL